MPSDLEWMALRQWWRIAVPQAVQHPLNLLATNLLIIIEDFLTYNQERFPNPLDQYIYIYENKDLILQMLQCNLEIESPFDDPVAYHAHLHISMGLEQMFQCILTCGNTHKFDPELIRENLERDVDEQG